MTEQLTLSQYCVMAYIRKESKKKKEYIYICVCAHAQVCVCMFVCLVAQLCATLCNPLNCSLSSVHGIFWLGILSVLSFPPLWDLPNPGIEPCVSCIASRFFTR